MGVGLWEGEEVAPLPMISLRIRCAIMMFGADLGPVARAGRAGASSCDGEGARRCNTRSRSEESSTVLTYWCGMVQKVELSCKWSGWRMLSVLFTLR